MSYPTDKLTTDKIFADQRVDEGTKRIHDSMVLKRHLEAVKGRRLVFPFLPLSVNKRASCPSARLERWKGNREKIGRIYFRFIRFFLFRLFVGRWQWCGISNCALKFLSAFFCSSSSLFCLFCQFATRRSISFRFWSVLSFWRAEIEIDRWVDDNFY